MNRRLFLAAASALATPPLAGSTELRAGCQTNAWRIDPQNFAELLAVLNKVKAYNYHGFETGFRNMQGQFDKASEAREAIEKHGLRFIGSHIFLTQYDPGTSIAPLDLFTRVLYGSALLGAERLILSGASIAKNGALDREALQRKAGALNHAGKLCRAKEMTLCYHNHDLEFARGAEEMEEMLRLTSPEAVHLIMDAGHAFRAGADVPRFFEAHAERIDGLHLRDFSKGRQVPLGKGSVDLKPLAAAIRRKAWTGWVINEEERINDVKPGDSAVAPARRHLRKIFGV